MDQVTPKQREALSEDQAAFYEENGYLVLEVISGQAWWRPFATRSRDWRRRPPA